MGVEADVRRQLSAATAATQVDHRQRGAITQGRIIPSG